jgi:hypothetical protein
VEFFVDDQPIQSTVDAGQPLALHVEEVRRKSADRERLIVSIRCDGADITGEGFETKLAQPATNFGRVDVYTGAPGDLVEDAMAQAQEMLDKSDAVRVKVVDLLEGGKAAEAVQLLGECMRIWMQIHQGIVNALALLNVDVSALREGDRAVPEILEGSRDRLMQVRDALEANDTVLLSDTLRYEFDDVVGGWRSVIRAICTRT